MGRAKHAGRERYLWDGAYVEVPTEHDLALGVVGARLGEARDILRAVNGEAKTAVREAVAAGLSERAVARALGVHRATVRRWRTE